MTFTNLILDLRAIKCFHASKCFQMFWFCYLMPVFWIIVRQWRVFRIFKKPLESVTDHFKTAGDNKAFISGVVYLPNMRTWMLGILLLYLLHPWRPLINCESSSQGIPSDGFYHIRSNENILKLRRASNIKLWPQVSCFCAVVFKKRSFYCNSKNNSFVKI